MCDMWRCRHGGLPKGCVGFSAVYHSLSYSFATRVKTPGSGGDVIVRFGSKADIQRCSTHVRFTSESGHSFSGHPDRCCDAWQLGETVSRDRHLDEAPKTLLACFSIGAGNMALPRSRLSASNERNAKEFKWHHGQSPHILVGRQKFATGEGGEDQHAAQQQDEPSGYHSC
jgi:hypothetical protein